MRRIGRLQMAAAVLLLGACLGSDARPEDRTVSKPQPCTCDDDLTTFTANNGVVDEHFVPFAVCCCAELDSL